MDPIHLDYQLSAVSYELKGPKTVNSKIKPSEVIDHLPSFISKMESEGLPSLVIDTFAYYYGEVLKGATGLVCDRDIQAVPPDDN